MISNSNQFKILISDLNQVKEYFYKRLQMFVLESYTSPYDSYASDIEHKEFILICPFCGVVFHRYLNKLERTQ